MTKVEHTCVCVRLWNFLYLCMRSTVEFSRPYWAQESAAVRTPPRLHRREPTSTWGAVAPGATAMATNTDPRSVEAKGRRTLVATMFLRRQRSHVVHPASVPEDSERQGEGSQENPRQARGKPDDNAEHNYANQN